MRVPTLSWRDANNIHEISFTFLDRGLFLWDRWLSTFQAMGYGTIGVYVWISRLPKQKHSALPQSASPNYLAGAKRNIHLLMADRGIFANFSNRPLWLKPERGPLVTRATTDGIDCFNSFHGPNYTAGQTGCTILAVTFPGRCCCEYHLKRRGHVLRYGSSFWNWAGLIIFWRLLPQKPR